MNWDWNFVSKSIFGLEWINSIVGKISPWIELDSSIELVRKNSEIVLFF